MLKWFLESLACFVETGESEPERAPPPAPLHQPFGLAEPLAPLPGPLPAAAMRLNYDPSGPQFGPMWRDPESAARAARIT